MKAFIPALVGLALTVAAAAHAQGGADTRRVPYLDETLPFARRVDDLVGRMTLAEKVSQMKDVADPIDRLGVPAYNWWNEGLHGVARAGLATAFPQAIGFAATWDSSLVYRMATVISDEFRAKYHDYIRHNQHGRYQGLTVWSPNINLFRDPRWGRGQETYGEDPYLTGHIAVPFIRGLQGDDPKYFKTIATVKHFAVHSGPEPDRHGFDAIVSERDLRESYLPQFEQGIKVGGAYSLMCAYNRIDGQAACASPRLEQDILRGEWKFPGYIVSDCGAIDDIYLRHKVAPTAAAAAAVAVKTGTDLDCGRVYPNLVDAVKQGLITEAQIDTSVKRLFLARMRLGMFDAPEHVRWANTPIAVLDQPSHRQVARQVARESIVLLKNANNTLPLRKTIGTLAVIGPNADQKAMLMGNYNGDPSDPVTPLRGIREAASPATKVLYARGTDLADDFPVLETVPPAALTTPQGQQGLNVEFFAGQTFAGLPVLSATDSTLDSHWGDGAPRGLNPDDFSVRWTGMLHPRSSGNYAIGLSGTMKFQLFIDDSLVVKSNYRNRNDETPDPRVAQSTVRLEAGRTYRIRVEANETYGDAQLQLLISTPRESLEADAMKVAQQADAIVMVLGLSARLEGEEMPVAIEGFRGGDRTRIDLPAAQQRFLEKVTALGKPVVLVLLNGSALAVNWAQEHVPAIVEGWYPGQAGGSALADVLFGDYNPAGRLPVTFYRDTTDLPAFSNYNMAGRTYRYFRGTPLYAFGHGLSYTSFLYSGLHTSAASIKAGGSVSVTVDVTNTGKRTGDEVVQLYTRHIGSAVTRPNRELRGFRRISLKPGERRAVRFALPASALAYWDESTHAWTLEGDTVALEIGASSADVRVTKNLKVIASR
jgi:beta-glucosidase